MNELSVEVSASWKFCCWIYVYIYKGHIFFVRSFVRFVRVATPRVISRIMRALVPNNSRRIIFRTEHEGPREVSPLSRNEIFRVRNRRDLCLNSYMEKKLRGTRNFNGRTVPSERSQIKCSTNLIFSFVLGAGARWP